MPDKLNRICKQLESKESSISLLNLSCEGFGSAGVEKLVKSCTCPTDDPHYQLFPYHCPFVALWLENNYIYAKGAQALARLFSISPSLKYLYMAHNNLEHAGVKVLSQEACVFQQLEILDLTDNQISLTGDGVQCMVKSLMDPKCTVRSMILEDNKLRNEGAKMIAECLKHNKSLKQLDLRYNQITEEGLIALRDSIVGYNTTLECLLLGEDDDTKCLPCSRPPPCSYRRKRKVRFLRPYIDITRQCNCRRCQIRSQIDYCLALNRAGRHEFGNMELSVKLWPRIYARVSQDDPTLMYSLLCERPDVVLSTSS